MSPRPPRPGAEQPRHPPPRVVVFTPEPALLVSVRTGADGGQEVTLAPGGQGYWVARMVAALDVPVAMCAPLGGRSGEAVRALAELEGVQVASAETHRSTAVWISTRPDGEEPDVARTPTPPLNRHELDELFGITLAAALDAPVLVLTGLADPGVLPTDMYGRLTRDLVANGVTVVADVSQGPLVACLAEGVPVVKVASDGLPDELGADPEGDPAGALAALRDRGAGRVLLSRAARPAVAHLDDAVVELRAPRLTELNHRGAGDSMTGALAAGIALGEPDGDILRRAVAAGALNVTRHGLGTGRQDAIAAFAGHVEVVPVGEARTADTGGDGEAG